jgi:roadblock/LC7 domain-containing protein
MGQGAGDSDDQRVDDDLVAHSGPAAVARRLAIMPSMPSAANRRVIHAKAEAWSVVMGTSCTGAVAS